MQPQHLQHKNGGRVTAIHGVGHRTLERVPYWFYLCDVAWSDGTKSEGIEVMPDRLCANVVNPAAVAEINLVSDALMAHLRKHGRWLKKGRWIGDRLVHWISKEPALVVPIG